jgi:aspartate aminotransferase-like enzyme
MLRYAVSGAAGGRLFQGVSVPSVIPADRLAAVEPLTNHRPPRPAEVVRLETGVARPVQQLRIPGPTPVPARVALAAAQPMINPRGPEFARLLGDCVAGLRSGLRTRNEVLLFGASGTGGLEAAVANLVSPGERVLFCTNGWFGELWMNMAAAFHADIVRVSAPWGEAVSANAVERALRKNPTVTRVFVTHNETSTGVLNDLSAIARVVKAAGCLLIVDSVSGAPSHPLPVDDLGIDVVVTASQKGWLAPPGLTMLTVSEAALQAAASSSSPKWYFDFQRQRACMERGYMHTTPPVSVVYALREGLAVLEEEGLAEVWARHARLGRRTRLGLRELGLQAAAAPENVSDTVTAVRTPFRSPPELKRFLRYLAADHGLVLAQGLGKWEGQVFRVGHLGAITEADIDAMLATLMSGLAQHRRAHAPRGARSEPRRPLAGTPTRFLFTCTSQRRTP